jgi:hypothetical protein
MEAILRVLILALLFEGVAALFAANVLRRRRVLAVGETLHVVRAPRGWRTVVLVLQLLALAGAFAVSADLGLRAALVLTPLAAAGWLAPAVADQRCGTDGVQYGWESRALGELESWRLTGDHLRFPLHGLWVAVALPRSLHPEMRVRLEAACPGRESKFQS